MYYESCLTQPHTNTDTHTHIHTCNILPPMPRKNANFPKEKKNVNNKW